MANLGSILESLLGGVTGGALASAADIASAGANAIASIPQSETEIENKKRLDKLKALMDSNSLGLSDKEKAIIRDQGASTIQKSLKESSQKAADALATSAGLGSGQGIASARTNEGVKAGLQEGLETEIRKEDIQKAKDQQDEYWARLAADDEAKQRRTQAWLNLLGVGLGTGSELKNSKEQIYGSGNKMAGVSNDKSFELSKKYGLTPDQSKSLQDLLGSGGGAPTPGDLDKLLTPPSAGK